MALALPRCAPTESLHQLASVRQRFSVHRSRRSARAKHGAAESASSKIQVASTDHIKIPSSEPCCKISSLVMAPKKPMRRSSRLRVKKGREDVKTDCTDMEASEWVSRALANNGVVEVDPLTIAEQMKTGSTNTTHNPVASLSTTSEVPDYFPPNGGIPRVPFGVAIAAGSAVVLATVAVLLQSSNRQKAGAGAGAGARAIPNQFDWEGNNNLVSCFDGAPVETSNKKHVTPDQSSKGPHAPQSPSHLTKDRKLPAVVLASTAGVSAGAAILSPLDLQPGSVRTELPSPSSPSKAGSKRVTPPREQRRKTSVWDSVTPFFSSHMSNVSSTRPTPLAPSWPEGKYKSVSPFFPSDRLAAATTGHENGSSSESVTPFFPDEQGSTRRYGSLSKNVTPFYPDEQSNKSRQSSLLENVTPFYPDERGRNREEGPSLKTATPFFADERGRNRVEGSSLEAVTPFFADEQGSENTNKPLLETVTPFFADEQGSKRKNGPSLETVTPFFADEQGRGSTGVSQSEASFNLENVTPFFPDDGVGRSGSTGQPSSTFDHSKSRSSQFGEQSDIWDGESSGATRDSQIADQRIFAAVPDDLLNGPVQVEGEKMLAEIANRAWPNDKHKEFIEERLSDALSFEGVEASSMKGFNPEVDVELELTPEELAFILEMKAEEERRSAKFQALQAAFPAVAIGAGALGALVGVDGAFQMVGLTATASFISYELLWANKRKELVEEVSRITDHQGLFRWLQKRKIVKDDC